MSGLLQNMFKGQEQAPPPGGDADFADFAGAPDQHIANPGSPAPATPDQPQPAAPVIGVQYTKWYRVWERTSPKDFIQEAFILPFIVFVLLFHVWGARKNRRKAKAWVQAHLPTLESEFAVVGYGSVPRASSSASNGAQSSEIELPENVLKENTLSEFATYATGRQNLAFADVSISLTKRYNPMLLLGDYTLGLFFESLAPQPERVIVSAFAFDGKEKDLVPAGPGDVEQKKRNDSSYNGFVFAIVHKTRMRQLRHDRYDISLTFTKDSPKLPESLTVMSESAEITETLLTPELIKAVEEAGDLFEYLIITDQPIEKPTNIEEAITRKRIILSLALPSSTSPTAYDSTLPLFQTFTGLADRLVSVAHFRQEILRKLRNIREEEIRKLKRADEEDKAEERKLAAEKVKKEDRERLLRTMSADEQKKYLEKEKSREKKKEMKRSTRKG